MLSEFQGPCLIHRLINQSSMPSQSLFSQCTLIMYNNYVSNEESHRKKMEKKEGREGVREGRKEERGNQGNERKDNKGQENGRKERGKRDILIAALTLWRDRQL